MHESPPPAGVAAFEASGVGAFEVYPGHVPLNTTNTLTDFKDDEEIVQRMPKKDDDRKAKDVETTKENPEEILEAVVSALEQAKDGQQS